MSGCALVGQGRNLHHWQARLLLAAATGNKRQRPVVGAIGPTKYLLGAAKMEIRMARIADGPTAVAGFQVGKGLVFWCFCRHGGYPETHVFNCHNP